MTWNAPIMGKSLARPEQLAAYALRENPFAPDLAGLYLDLASRLGVRGDVAYAQALVETNGFRMDGWPERGWYNFAGLGVTRPGEPGVSFRSPEEGVLAHLEALYLQASGEPLPPGLPNLVPFLPEPGRAHLARVGDLRRPGWPADEGYGEAVARTLAAILLEPAEGEPFRIEPAFLSPDAPGRPGARDASGAWRGVEGIVVHRSGSPCLDGDGMRALLERPVDVEPRSYHFVVDDRAIRQLVPVGEIACHTPGRNHRDIGIMVCEHNWGTPAWREAYRRLVWLAARLMVVFQVPVERLSGHFWWDPVDHPYDPTHLGWRAQDGPATGLFDWNRFVADVAAAQAEAETVFCRQPAGTAAGNPAEAAAPGGGPGTARQAVRRAPDGGWVQATLARMKSRRFSSRRR